MKLFNWLVLLVCGMLFAVGGTISAMAAICLSANAFLSLFAIGMSAGFLVLSGSAFRMMERF